MNNKGIQMKKILSAFILSYLITSPVLANESMDIEINDKLASIGFGKLFAFDPKEQITNLFKDYEKCGNKHQLNKLKNFYHEKYVNADGFSYDTYFKLVEQTWAMYPDMQYP